MRVDTVISHNGMNKAFCTLHERMQLVWYQITWEGVPPVEFMNLVFTCMPGERYSRRYRSFCCCVYATAFQHLLTPLYVDSFVWYHSHSKKTVSPGLDCRERNGGEEQGEK